MSGVTTKVRDTRRLLVHDPMMTSTLAHHERQPSSQGRRRLSPDLAPAPRRRVRLRPPVIRVPRQQARIAKDQDQERAGHEPANVGPESHAAALITERPESADELDQKPVAKHHVRRHRDGRDEEAQEDEHVDVYTRI